MTRLQSSRQGISPSVFELEAEVSALRRQLQTGHEKIRALQDGAVDVVELHRIEESFRKSQQRLEMELADTKLLQSISSHLLHEENVESLYVKITEAAVAITQSEFACLQIFHPERGEKGELRLLASSGLDEEGKAFWAWVGPEAGTTCAVALRTGQRCISSDMLNADFVIGTKDHAVFERAGIQAAQSTPLYSRHGQLLGMISTHWARRHVPSDRDLKLLDILARQAADLLDRKMSEALVQKSQTDLTEADRRKDEFLATLAHELRNPLSPIRNALQIMRKQPTGEKAQELISMMDRQVTHLVRLIDDLLDVSRLSQGKIDLRRERIALQTAIAEATEASRPLIDSHAHKLTIDVPTKEIWIDADLTRMAQIVGNLLNNAAKYTPKGGHIFLSARSDKGQAVLSVSDTGVGIPASMLPKVFDLFTQVDRNLDRAQGGLGIGLSLVQQLLAMHEGDIRAESLGVNRGSTFTFNVPLAPAPEEPALLASKSDHQLSKAPITHRILVVDDNEPSAQTVGWMLELDGHEYKLAHTGADALTLASTFAPTAILLDIGLPGMNGYDLCRELRMDDRFKKTVIIAQTGWGQERDRQLAKEAGFDHHLVKPLNFTQLSEILSRL